MGPSTPKEKAASEVEARSEVKMEATEVRARSEVKMETSEVTEDEDNSSSCWRQRMAARTLQSGSSFSLARYRSVRDHNGRYYLVVKVR